MAKRNRRLERLLKMRSMLDSLCGRNGYEANVLDEIQGMVEEDIERLEGYRRLPPDNSGIPKMQSVWPSSRDEGSTQLQIQTERGEECEAQGQDPKQSKAKSSKVT